MRITMTTEKLRKDLAQIWKVAPFRVEVGLTLGRLDITVDGLPATQEQLDLFEKRITKIASETMRSRLN